MAGTLVNAGDVDVTGWGGSAVNVTKRSSASAGAATDVQIAAGVNASVDRAMVHSAVTAAGKALIAGQLLDEIVASIDLSTPQKREAQRLKRGLQEMIDVLAQIGA